MNQNKKKIWGLNGSKKLFCGFVCLLLAFGNSTLAYEEEGRAGTIQSAVVVGDQENNELLKTLENEWQHHHEQVSDGNDEEIHTHHHQENEKEIAEETSPDKELTEEEKLKKKMEDERQRFIQGVKQELFSAKDEYDQVNENMNEIEARIKELGAEKLTLRRQVSLLNFHLEQSELKIQSIQKQVAKKEGDLGAMHEHIKVKELEIKQLESDLKEYLQMIYLGRNEYIGFNEGDSNVMKMLFADESIGEILDQNAKYSFLEKKANEMMDEVSLRRNLMGVLKDELETETLSLQKLRYQLRLDKKRYEQQQEAKKQLLEETKGKEEIYQNLLEQSKQQQEAIEQEIALLANNVDLVQEKMKKYGDFFNVADYRELIDKRVGDITVDSDVFAPRWPVSTKLGISAYFSDAGYKAIFGVDHGAVDIPIAQSTPVRAMEDAVVYKAKDNGLGYSYIVLAHRGGYMSLYGHMSDIQVIPGEKVHKGQVIGLSGGAPGTRGAGLRTTGAHLHLEVFKGGKKIDPLLVLPLSQLPLRSVPKKYLGLVRG